MTLTTEIVSGVSLRANKILVEIMINNLVTNAIRYSNVGETIRISLTDQSLRILNPGAVSLKQERLFRRFSTGSSESPGTGLGLALVKEICSRYEWTVGYGFSDGLHSFSVLFTKNL